jgi:EAL domain-containing protein (putative c-di-GMP-specific phosphodiesterase class I)
VTSGDDRVVDGAMRLLRAHLGLDVAFVSQLTDGQRIFRYVDANDQTQIAVGDSDPAEESYCHWVIRGEVPEFLPDPSAHPVTAAMPATAAVPVGTHFSVPLRLSDGSVYGTFCGFSRDVLDGVSERDLDVVRLFAGLVVGQIEQDELARRAQLARRSQLLALQPGLDLVFVAQPIHDLAGSADALDLVGHELLARFPTLGQGPAEVFDAAWMLGVGPDLELATVHMAVAALEQAGPGVYLAVNLAPESLVDPRILDAFESNRSAGLVVEVTEHAQVADYTALRTAIDRIKACGIRIAVDDVGTGFSGLEQILRLEPDILKIDGALVRDLDRLAGKEAMVASLVTFARRVGASVVAEQIETPGELAALQRLGVSHGQGYLLGRPLPLDDALVVASEEVGARGVTGVDPEG